MSMLPRLIPVLLIDDFGLIKTRKFSNPKYLGDPLNALKIFNEKEVDEVIIIDRSITGKGLNFDFLEHLAQEAFMPLGYVGGIKSESDARRLISIGYEKIGFNSAIVDNEKMVNILTRELGSQSVFAVIDSKKPLIGSAKAFIKNGRVNSGHSPLEFAQKAISLGVGELIVQSIENDGCMKGFDLKLISDVSRSSTVPLVALGGAGSISDFQLAIKAGASAVAAGSFFSFLENDRNSILINYPSYSEVEKIFEVKV